MDRVVVQRAKRQLILMDGRQIVKTYRIALGKNPLRHKQCEGDNITPEGTCALDWKTDKTKYYRAMHVSYPNRLDRDAARRRGCPTGGDILILGLPTKMGWLGSLHRLLDWTRACIALTNSEIEEIYAVVRVGTPIQIDP